MSTASVYLLRRQHLQSGSGGGKMASSKERDLGSTAAFNKLVNIFVGRRDTGKVL